MSIQEWSNDIYIVELSDDPQFSDDLKSLFDLLENHPEKDVVLDFRNVSFINSSNIAKLLKLRRKIVENKRHLRLCNISTHIWGVFLVTGLDSIFEYTDDISSALASLQIENRKENQKRSKSNQDQNKDNESD